MQVRIVINGNNTPGKLAEAELHFDEGDGVLAGLKLIGFAVWERRGGSGRNVTFPARQYSINGERRSFALLRPLSTGDYRDGAYRAQEAVREAILKAYDDVIEAGAWSEGRPMPREKGGA